MKSITGTYREIQLTGKDVMQALNEFIEKHHNPRITIVNPVYDPFPDHGGFTVTIMYAIKGPKKA